MRGLWGIACGLAAVVGLTACGAGGYHQKYRAVHEERPSYYDLLVYNDAYLQIFRPFASHWMDTALEKLGGKREEYADMIRAASDKLDRSENYYLAMLDEKISVLSLAKEEAGRYGFLEIGLASLAPVEIVGPGFLTLVFDDEGKELAAKDDGILFTRDGFWNLESDTRAGPVVFDRNLAKIDVKDAPPQHAFVRLPAELQAKHLLLLRVEVNLDRRRSPVGTAAAAAAR
jgi:hypothetical protein